MHSDQLRQRLVRMSVCHHEQLFVYQQREYQLTQALKECTSNLEAAVSFANSNSRGLPPGEILEALSKFTLLCTSLAQDSMSVSGSTSVTTSERNDDGTYK